MKRFRALPLTAVTTAFAFGSPAWASPKLTTLVSFNSTVGELPLAGLLADSAGNLYGTTAYGGPGGNGTVFEAAAQTYAVTVLASFDGSNGVAPNATLIADPAGNLYGTTEGTNGDDGNYGTVFEVAAGTNALSTLVTFTNDNGANPEGGLVADASGNLYGTTRDGGLIDDESPYGEGTLYEVAAGTQTFSTLANFNGSTGTNPTAGLTLDAAGNLYGTTTAGGIYDDGTVFEVPAGTQSIKDFANFNGANGSAPTAGLIDVGGNLYGTTSSADASSGTVFEIAAGTHTVTTLATFNFTNGAQPDGSLIMDAAGDLFGTTSGGGADDYGTVFEVAAGSDSVTTLATFNLHNGAYPYGNLIADAAGNLYGTALDGGPDAGGTVFEISNSGFVVPEPTSLSLFALTVPALLRRRNRAVTP